LWKLGDDYSAKVISDFFLTDDAESVAEVVRGINGYLREPIVSSIAPLFARDNAAIHEAVRHLLLQCADVPVRRRALDMVIDARGDALGEDEDPTEFEAVTPTIELSSERSAFQFERENMEELVMFFSDIQGYSKKAQSLTPMQLSELVTEYEKILLTHVESHGGQLVKRMGDGHMIVFKKPLPAVLAAIRLQKSLRRFNRYRDETNRVVIRIGVHSGKVVRNSQGDVLGNAVNVASRLESSARPGSVLISDLIQERIADAVHSREIGRITVKNIAEPIRVFEPYEIKVNLPGELDPLQGANSESSQNLPLSDSVTLDRETYVEVIRCFSALITACKRAEADQVSVRELNTHVIDRLNRLRPRLPKLSQQRRSQDGN
jgi:class 3 adenylate cyclase